MYTLICAQAGEASIENVLEVLKAKKQNPVLLERYRRDHFVTYSYTNNKLEGTLKIEGKSYPLTSETFPSVWFRIKPTVASEIPGEKSHINEKFCTFEWRQVLNTLDLFLEKSKWINKIKSGQTTSNKSFQLKLALECGMQIPETRITNNNKEVLKLFSKGAVIYKTLSSFFTAKEAIYTNAITAKQVNSNHGAIAMAPGIYQQLIEKDHELRVTVVGDHVFPIKINSQRNKKTAVDWRHYPYEDMYDKGELSVGTMKKLLTFHKKADLIYASYDFIVDKNGNEIFLECNPAGQWLWLEKYSRLSVADILAEELKRT